MLNKKKITATLAMSFTAMSLIGGVNVYANDTGLYDNYLFGSPNNIEGRVTSNEVSTPEISGVTYHGKTEASIGIYSVSATSHVRSSKTVQPGRMGVHTALYKEGTGTAIRSSSWSYNTSSGKTHKVHASVSSPANGKYQARGTMKGYDESTGNYYGKSLISTSYVTYKSMPLTISEEELKERMMMFETKDMIAAEGLNGEVGYISLTDMGVYENPSSPDEALKIQQERIEKYGYYQDINVYDTDGNIIDKFRIDHNM